MSCRCDQWIHPPVLKIDAGLDRIPRQVADFGDFRRAMLAARRGQDPLAGWGARDKDDLGVMLIEMWAYVCDVLAFYDEVIAQEAYLRTARRRDSIRKLTERLGYLPRPAVGAQVVLAALAEGRKTVRLPVGTAFRSEAFDDEPPQIFELEQESTIHPLTNSWSLVTPRSPIVSDTQTVSSSPELIPRSYFLLKPETADFEAGDAMLVRITEPHVQSGVRVLREVAPIQGEDGGDYVRVKFEPEIKLDPATVLAEISLSKPTQRAGLWTIRSDPKKVPVVIIADGGKSQVILDGLYRQIRPNDFVLFSKGKQYRWFQILKVEEVMMEVMAAKVVIAKDGDGKDVKVPVPPVNSIAANCLRKCLPSPAWSLCPTSVGTETPLRSLPSRRGRGVILT